MARINENSVFVTRWNLTVFSKARESCGASIVNVHMALMAKAHAVVNVVAAFVWAEMVRNDVMAFQLPSGTAAFTLPACVLF